MQIPFPLLLHRPVRVLLRATSCTSFHSCLAITFYSGRRTDLYFSEEAKNNKDIIVDQETVGKDLCAELRARFEARGPVSPALSFAMVRLRRRSVGVVVVVFVAMRWSKGMD